MTTSRAHRLLSRMVRIEPHEVKATLLGFSWFACLLSGYYLLRPLRDAMGLVGGVEELRWLFTATFLTMLLLVPAFGLLVSRLAPRRFVPFVYRFFALTLLGFSALMAMHVESVWLGRTFFVWVSVFNLFIVSIFWSVLDDRFSSEQGRRLFGFIAAGGTLGTVVGPLLAAAAVSVFGPMALALAAALLLELALRCFRGIYPDHRQAGAQDGGTHAVTLAQSRPLGGQVWAGLSLIARSPYLLGICAYLLAHTAASTFLYFEQGRIVADAFADTASRTRYFALVDFCVSSLTLALQVCVTGALMRKFGLVLCLAMLPLVTVAAFGALALAPTLAVLAGVQIFRRSLDYAIARPAREVLFTVISREQKYKSKNAIETLVYRGGDAVSGWLSAALSALGVGLGGIALLAIPLSAAWCALCVWLARRQEVLRRTGATRPAQVSATFPEKS
ncbi:NTP/NDP exchange transporter [Pantoea sp. 18069]|uniref:NTP/NDP exchange transporter n=1 Tax=Pantoea sp. 18069 TaxID=2681415 RepID=UPI00190F3220|nr:MFS transporter [Pantoea sp. 18069]